ncbi:MAG: hypothetical protein AAGK05_19180, partial [Pseudomonadota bacterium]
IICFYTIKKLTDTLGRTASHNNLTRKERLTLRALKKKEFIFLPSDKGGEFCVLENERYKEIGEQHLSNTDLYCSVSSISPKTIESKVNKVWRTIAQKNNVCQTIIRSHTATNTDLAKFYFLIKTHKSTEVPKIRPIVSNVNCPISKISWLLDKALKPLLQHVPAHLDNTQDLITRINSLPEGMKRAHSYPFSLDVVSMYTSIPQQDAIDVVERMMKNHNYNFFSLSPSDIAALLKVILENNYFTFENKVYRQLHGLAMGSSVSTILAILYM